MPRIPTYQQDPLQKRRISPGIMDRGTIEAPPVLKVTSANFGARQAQAVGNLAAGLDDLNAGIGRELAAKRTLEASQIQQETRRQITNFTTGLASRNDFENFQTEYDQLIDNIRKDYEDKAPTSIFLAALNQDLDELSRVEGVRVSNITLEQGKTQNLAGFLAAKNNYLEDYAGADPYKRADILKQMDILFSRAVKAKVLAPDDAIKQRIDFNRKTDKVKAEQDLRRDPEKFNPDNYMHLSGADRIALSDHAIRMVEANRKERIRLQTQAEKAEEKAATKRREDFAMGLLTRLDDRENPLTMPELETMIKARKIDYEDAKFFRRALLEPPERDDAVTVFMLSDMVLEGQATKRDIYNALIAGKITGKTATGYLEDLKKAEAADDVTKKPDYKDALAEIKSEVRTTGIMEKYDIDQEARINAALEEFKTRARDKEGGESIKDIREDIIRRYRPTPPGIGAYPNPIYGSKQDPEKAFNETKEARDRGEITEEVYRREVRNLYQIQQALDRQEARRREITEKTKQTTKKRPH